MVAWYDIDDELPNRGSPEQAESGPAWRERVRGAHDALRCAFDEGRRTLIGSVLLFGFAGAFALVHVTPEYRAAATLQVEGREADAIFRALEAGEPMPEDVFARAAIGLGFAPTPAVLDRLRAGERFEGRRAARTVVVAFRSADAEAAANAANALADSYRHWRTDRAIDGTARSIAELRVRIESLERRLADLSVGAERGRPIEAEIVSARGLIDGFRARLDELRAEDGTPAAALRLYEDAEAPSTPDWPPVALVMTASVVCGALTGFGLVLRRQRRADRIASPEDLEATMGAPCLATLPALPGGFFAPPSPAEAALAQEGGAFALAISGLDAALVLAESARLPKVLLITGPADEPETAEIASAFARVAAKSRRHGRVVMVGAAADFVERGRASVEDYVEGRAGIDDLFGLDPASRLVAVRARDRTKVFGTPGFRRLLGELAPRFDLVVVDAPPIRRRSDARTSAELADMALVVATWAATPRRRALRCARLLADTGMRLAAVLRGADFARLTDGAPRPPLAAAGPFRRHYGD